MSDEDIPDGLGAALQREGLDSVEGAFAYRGGEDLDKPGLAHRRRTRLTLTDDQGRGHLLYLKRYGAEGIAAALRRWLRHGRPQSAAGAEFDNIRAAQAAGVPTMRAIDWGQDPCPLGAKRSYLIVTAVPGEALERCFEDFRSRHAADGDVGRLTGKLAHLVRTLHGSGYVHRDLYASHVFLDESGGQVELYLIDLARMFAPRWRRARWCVKDLAQLKYSLPAAWVAEFWQAFLLEYLPGSDPRARERLDRAIDRKVASMRRRAGRRGRRAEKGSHT